jgi:hypothetical protein
MVSIGVIAVLIAILLPVIHSVREQGRGVVCQSHLRQLWQGFVAFSADHDGRLPGNNFDFPVPSANPDGGDWLAAPANTWVDSFSTAPQGGTLFKYVGGNYSIYRCPSLELASAPWYEGGIGAGSNGRWDYVAFTAFAGCHLQRVPNTCTFSADGTTLTLPTPIICEEEAGTINGSNMEGCHSEWDQLGHQHRGGCYYASPDGTVNWFAEPMDANAWSWSVLTSAGKPYNIGNPSVSGYFERRSSVGWQ